jgi:proliferating cell nuclear antigen
MSCVCPPKQECLFLMHSVQSHALKCMVESLKDVLIDVSLHLSEEGIKICTLDFSRTAIVYMKIDANKCEEFFCPNPMSVGISVASLFKLIKTVALNDMLSFFIHSSTPELLQVHIDCTDRCIQIHSQLHTLDLDDNSISIPKIDFGCIILFPSTEFQRNIRDLSNVAEYVDIKVDSQEFVMSAKGDFATQKLIFRERLNGMQFQSKSNETIVGRFSLKYLSLFSKSANLSNFVEIYIKENIPLVLKYSIGNIGRMQFVLSPREKID